MKKLILTLLTLPFFLLPNAVATIHTILLEAIDFVPADLTVSVGDTISWVWVVGIHTTTSTNIPGEAAAWDEEIDQSSPLFNYVVTTPGIYEYVCLFHESQGMVGSFTATETTDVGEVSTDFSMDVTGNPVVNQIVLSLHFPEMTRASVQLYDMMGRLAEDFGEFQYGAGDFAQALPVDRISPGLYLLKVRTGKGHMLRKVMIE